MTKVVLPKKLTKINEYTFERCENLQQIRIPNKVKTIGQGAFEDSGLIRIELPKSVKSIADDAFGYNSDRIFYVEKGSYAEKYAKNEDETYIVGGMPQIENFKKIKSCNVADIPDQIFEKNGLNVSLVIKDGDVVLKENVDYLIGEYYPAEKGGKNDYVIEIKGAGAYTGTIEKQFKGRNPQIKDAEKMTKGKSI